MKRIISYTPSDERIPSEVQIAKEPGQLTLTGIPKGHELLLLAVSKRRNKPNPKWKEISNTAWMDIFFVLHHPTQDKSFARCQLHIGMAGSLYKMRVKTAWYDDDGTLRVLYADEHLYQEEEEGTLYVPKDIEESKIPPCSDHFGYTGEIEVIDHKRSYFELNLETVKPSDFDISSGYFSGALGEHEQEVVARRIVMMMQKTGDKWRPFTLKEYNTRYDVSNEDTRGLQKLTSVGRLENNGSEISVTDQLIEDLEKYIIK